MFLSMAYAGSRTPFILIPAAMGLYTLLNLNKKVLLVVGALGVVGAGMIMKSTSNPVIYRIQSAFEPTTDASVQVRLENQKIVQPFIQSNPFGAGLGTTGVWGERFSPDYWLAGFPHDSAYVRMALETGWLGLLIYMGIFFVAFQLSVYYYFRVQHPQIKSIYLGLSMITFILGMASYPQEVVTLLPNSIIYYILLAIMVRLKDFDEDTVPAMESPSTN
jgi:O-antigen ligase